MIIIIIIRDERVRQIFS